MIKFVGRESVVKLLSLEMEGEIRPERDMFSREISRTFPVVGSQVTPRNLQGDPGPGFHDSKALLGSLRRLLNSSSASVSTAEAVISGRKECSSKQAKHRRENLAISRKIEGTEWLFHRPRLEYAMDSTTMEVN